MSKVDTDQGLGPGSERMRRDVQEAQKDLDSRARQKAADPVAVDKNAITEPGLGKVDRKSDTVDDLLDGFGTSRPDLPRILPKADTTPPPEPVKKELTPTEPGKRQKTRNMVLATLLTFGVVVAVGVIVVKMGSASSQATPTPTVTAPPTTSATPTNTAQVSTAQTEVVPPITTMPIESLPTARTATPPPSTAKTVHSAPTATTTATTATTTTTSPHPTGSAPPGMNLLPDDPHR